MSGALQDSALRFTANAFVREVTPFKPEDTRLGQYTFLPYVRTGLAARLSGQAGNRGTVTVSVQVQDTGGNVDAPVAKTLHLRGPGDVVGIDPAQVIRRVPADGTVAAEETFLAHVEFDRPEMPWLFTPEQPADGRLKPWIALVVCDANAATVLPGANGNPQQLRTRNGELPRLDEAWAWAHAQILGPADGPGPSKEDRLSEAYGPTNLSRLICPRKLEPQHRYIAAVVPTYDCGVRAGLGTSGGTLGPAWSSDVDPDAEVLLPAYVVWRFSVGVGGDFRSLAERIVPVKADWRIGRRLVDASQPGGGIANLAPDEAGRVQILDCALVSPADPPATSTWSVTKRDELRRRVDVANASSEELPRVGPRMYARYQRGTNALGPVFGDPAATTAQADEDWFSQLNTDPAHRIIAGVGTRVVQKDQELLMQSAWAQAGELRKVNQALIRMQFGRFVAESMHKAHLSKLALGELTQVLRGVHDKVRAPGSRSTVYAQIDRSVVPSSVVGSAFRRATRTRGPLARFTDAGGLNALRHLIAPAENFRDMRRPVTQLDGVVSLSPEAIQALPLPLIAEKLGVPTGGAAEALKARLATRSTPHTVVDVLKASPSTWRVPADIQELTGWAVRTLTERIAGATPANAVREPGRAEALAGLLVGVANSRFADTGSSRALLRRINRATPYSAPVPHIPAPIGVLPTLSGRVARFGTQAPDSASEIAQSVVRSAPLPVARFETEASHTLLRVLAEPMPSSAEDLAQAFVSFAQGVSLATIPQLAERTPLRLSRATLLDTVAPGRTMTAYVKARLGRLPGWLPADWFDNQRIDPVMKAPRFDRPMYEAVDAYDREWLVPGLGTIDKPDYVTLLQTNPAYTEAMLIGLSDEMGRELLWRGYDTDQRGTYFFRFWDAFSDELAVPIHRFDTQPLKSHLKGASAGSRVVIVIRGELLRRYPDAVVAAARASKSTGKPEFEDPSVPGARARVLFSAHLPPDYVFVGFELTETQVRDEPWWFLIAEHPTAPRFGMAMADQAAPGGSHERDQLDWDDLGPLYRGRYLTLTNAAPLVVKETPVPASGPATVTWPGNAAVTAHVLLRDPVRAAFEARRMLDGAR